MKRLILLLFSGMAFAQTFTLSGHVVDPSTAVPSQTTVTFKLVNTGTQQCKVSGTGLIVPNTKAFTPDNSGVISGTLYRNDFITCGNQTNSQWAYTINQSGTVMPTCVLAQVKAASLNLDNTACSNTVPVATPPTGDNTYCRLDGSNCGFTGTPTFPNGIGGAVNFTGALTAQSVELVANAADYATGGIGTSGNPWTSPSGTGGVQEAVNAICNNVPNTAGKVYMRAGYYRFTGSGTEILTIPCPIELAGASPMSTIFWLDPGMASTVNIVRVKPSSSNAFLQDNWIIHGFSIQKSSGGSTGGTAFVMDGSVAGTTGPAAVHLYDVYIAQSTLQGWGIDTVGTGSSNMWNWHIYDNTISNGIRLTNVTADVIEIHHNQIGYLNGIDITGQAGSSHILIFHNNIFAPAGIHVHYAEQIKILYNQMEQILASTETNSAMIDMDGDTSQILNCEIVGNNLNTHNNATLNVRIRNATGCHIHDNKMTLTAATGIGIQVVNVATNTIIGPNTYVGEGGGAVGISDSVAAGAGATQYWASTEQQHESYRMQGTNPAAFSVVMRGAPSQSADILAVQTSAGSEVLGVDNSGTIRTSGTVAKYGGIVTTGGAGVPPIFGTPVQLTGQVANLGATTIYTTASGTGIGKAGFYRVCAAAWTTSTGNSTVTINAIAPSGAGTVTAPLPQTLNTAALTNPGGGCTVLNVAASSTIQVSVTGYNTTGTYSISATVEQLI